METDTGDRALQYLVETDWLAAHLDDSNLRIIDCTVFTKNRANGKAGFESGRLAWEQGHIPGSTFVDLFEEVADRNSDFYFTMPLAAQFAEAMSRHGVGEGTRVILYDAAMTIGAARLWWMLRTFGFDNAAILNGGWKKWQREKRPLSVESYRPVPGNFMAQPRFGLIASKEEVLASLGNRTTCLINALSETYYHEMHIPNSVNVPADKLLNSKSQTYLSLKTLRQKFEQIEALDKKRIITYCDCGIWASSDAFVLTLLGVENVAVYDGSMAEWMADSTLPVEIG